MSATPQYDIIDPETGKIDRRIFMDQAIYDEEMAQIFGRAWLMIGHESLVPRVNDFFHTYMGEDPVILTRDGQGRLHALLNMCRHRGNRVVRCDDGNRSEEHTSELQSPCKLVCRLLLEKKKKLHIIHSI